MLCDAVLERAVERAGCGLVQREPAPLTDMPADAAIACPRERPHARATPEPAYSAGIRGMDHSP